MGQAHVLDRLLSEEERVAVESGAVSSEDAGIRLHLQCFLCDKTFLEPTLLEVHIMEDHGTSSESRDVESVADQPGKVLGDLDVNPSSYLNAAGLDATDSGNREPADGSADKLRCGYCSKEFDACDRILWEVHIKKEHKTHRIHKCPTLPHWPSLAPLGALKPGATTKLSITARTTLRVPHCVLQNDAVSTGRRRCLLAPHRKRVQALRKRTWGRGETVMQTAPSSDAGTAIKALRLRMRYCGRCTLRRFTTQGRCRNVATVPQGLQQALSGTTMS